ncbi:MAG: alpha-amylase family glycosyl hydrolase [Verrucomicrobiae bacterium]|nr:alpha-amylase family glycosyl hydrolase [Verrucomicrobiae bacterium]
MWSPPGASAPWSGSHPVRTLAALSALLLLLLAGPPRARAEAMLQLFNVNWDELIQKMPEIAEAGYTSLWLPPPAKAGSVFSVGYDQFDPFDLGDKNQRGTVRTRYGTKEQLLQVVELAHRFGLRVYFDNIMNHRGFDIPGYNASTPTNLYPGLVPQDFHLRRQADGTYRNWNNISDWGNVWQVQNRPLFGLIDLANEPGSLNLNFGPTEGSTTPKLSFVRQPANREYYMDTNLPPIVPGAPWRPFNGTNGDPVIEDVNAYLIRAAIWTLNETKCDGFRFDAVKHVPSVFFGDTSATANGYVGAIQTMFDWVHGYGNNVLGNGYVEGDDNRNSCFDTEVARNDALLFGEHLGEPPSFQEYLDRGMRLLNSPYHFHLNNVLGNPSATLSGLDQRDFTPGYGFSGRWSVLFAQSHDDNVATRRELQNAYNFMREGLPCIYSDGYNQSGPPDYFPKIANAPYLGQFGDNKMPDLAYLHHQLARGGTRPRWSDADVVAFERFDSREGGSAADQTVVLFAMNDNYAGTPSGEISFDDGVAQTTAGTYYECFPVQNSRGVGLVVGFPPGTVLVQLADSPNKNRACTKLLVRQATQNLSEAISTANDPNPANRKVYVGSQTLAPGGGAIEFKIPSGSYVMYGIQWPEPSRANVFTNAILIRQGGRVVPRITVLRRDGLNGDANFNPLYPFKMRGSVDPTGAILTGVNVSNRTYAIDVPIVTNGPMDIWVRCDASAVNTLVKLDGGTDLNSHMGITNQSAGDFRDNRPGSATDVFLGYEQTAFQFRYGPEKFAAANTNRNTLVSLGAETYIYTVGGTNFVVNGPSSPPFTTNSTAAWVWHDPAAGTTVAGGPSTQRVPLNPTNGGPVDIWVRAGYQFQINRCFIYYTTDGSNPEGAFGVGKGSTRVVEAFFAGDDTTDGTIDWWKGTIPASNNLTGVQVRYKVALFHDAIPPMGDWVDAKVYGLNQAAITNFNPASARVWLHNNRNTNHTRIGLSEGFHIIRARCFLPRTNKSSVFNTFAQTFYYDSALPTGAIAAPATNGVTLSNTTYQIIVRGDASVTGVEVNIQDSDPNNDDAVTGQNYGNGLTNGVPKFAAATAVTPDPALNALYPDFPLEFRFTYQAVPTNGTATITVRLKEASTAVLPDRFTDLTRSVNTLAPGQVLQIVAPAFDGQVLTLESNDVYTLRACFSQSLGNNIDFFSIYINGVYQPRRAPNLAPLYFISPSGCGSGLRQLSYDWAGAQPGTNVIQVFYTNAPVLSDTRTVIVQRPVDPSLDTDGDGMPDWMEQVAGTNPNDPNSVLRITELANGNQLVVWDSVPGVNYQVLATTNLHEPMQPISPVIQASGSSSFYFDAAPDATNKFYRIQVVP